MKNIYKKGLFLSSLLIVVMVHTPVIMAEGAVESVVAQGDKGPHNGKMLRQRGFAIELAIVEDGVPPEFRVWGTFSGRPVDAEELSVSVTLTRLGDIKDEINFYRQGNFLRGDMEIYEPHSFQVTLVADYQGEQYLWQYDNFEGRVSIPQKIAKANGIVTKIAEPATLVNNIISYGRLVPLEGSRRDVRARFPGFVKKTFVEHGDKVKKGTRLFTIESNQGLNDYAVRAPISGVVSERMVAEGDVVREHTLLRLVNTEMLKAELFIFPGDVAKLQKGAPVTLHIQGSERPVKAQINFIGSEAAPGRGLPVHVEFENKHQAYHLGMFVRGEIETRRQTVDLAVERDAIQAFRDFQVVYAKVGDIYEVRMLELGLQDDHRAEVLGGLLPGTEYVVENSYVIKADIEKSGASHDH